MVIRKTDAHNARLANVLGTDLDIILLKNVGGRGCTRDSLPVREVVGELAV